jgi:RNA polymerase sigma-70 factor (ECF subfamily)
MKSKGLWAEPPTSKVAAEGRLSNEAAAPLEGSANTLSIDSVRVCLVESLPRLRSFSRAYCGNRADADDAVQITCERILQRWRQWSGQGAFDHWAIKILVNVWRDELRSRKVRAGPDLDAIPEREDASQGNASDGLYLDQVRAEILRLPEAQREVLLLVVSEGLSYQETANALGIPIGTVMSRLCRARQTLIDKFGDTGV